jgi:signal transduction histidine kinase
MHEVGQRLSASSPWYRVVQAGGGTFRSPGLLAGSSAAVSVHPLQAYPLVVNVSIQEHDGLALWRRDVGIIAMAAACAVAGLLVLFGVIGRQLRRMTEQNAVLQRTAAELRESEQQAAKNLRMLEATLEHMDQGLIMIDAERRVPICNRRAIELLTLPHELMARGPKFEEVLAFQWSQNEFVGTDEEFRSFVRRGLLLDGPRNYERRRPDGRVLEVRTTMLPEGEAVRTYTDVTERRSTLESLARARDLAEEANRTKSAFLANMSHELRTPLNAILGFSELIRDQSAGALNAAYISYAEDINAGGRYLLELVNDLLDLSKIEAGHYDLVEERVNLGKLLSLCQRMMAPRAEAANVKIIYEPAGAVATLWVDQRAVKQVLLNLLDNAIKFSPAGGVTSIRVDPQADGGLAVLVRDDGIGIEPQAISFLFEPFSQADTSISRRFGGTGLGLAISRRLMTLMEGTLEITSLSGVGTTVRMIFPAVRVIYDASTTDTVAG